MLCGRHVSWGRQSCELDKRCVVVKSCGVCKTVEETKLGSCNNALALG